MQTGTSPLNTTPLASPAEIGDDPRRFLAASFPAAGGLRAKLSMEAGVASSMDLGGELDAPFVRIRRTGLSFQGLFGQGADLLISPVMVTLDGGGGLLSAVLYSPGWMKSVVSGGGGLAPNANAFFRGRIRAEAGAGMSIRLSEYQKIKGRLEAGGGLSPVVSRKQYLEATFLADGRIKVSPWYDLIGEVDEVIAKRVQVVVARTPRTKVTCVVRLEPEDIIVLEVGI